MKMDYQLLIGKDFHVGDDVYTVRDVAWTGESALVEADVKSARDGSLTRQNFPVGEVLQWLLVDEEIELFNPNFLAAR